MVEEVNIAQERKKKLKKILKTEPDHRSDDDIRMIENLVEDNKFLKQFKGTVKLKELCKYMRIQHFGVRETIIQEGDIGDTFYIIYSGRVSVYKQERSEFSESLIMKHLTELSSGDSFGELALLQKAPRQATVIASIPTDLIFLDKKTYENVIQNLQFYQIDGTIEFFQHMPLFQHLSRKELFNIASKCQYKRFPTNTIILRQDDIPKSVYFIKAGRIKLLRKVDFKLPEDKKQAANLDFLIQDPTEEDYELELAESKLLEIDDLSNGDTFGEDSILLKIPIKHSVITTIPSEIFMLDSHDFLKLDKIIMDSFLQFTKPYPEDRDLRRAFIEMNKWNKFKQDMIKTVKAEHINKKQNFEKQLRRPLQVPIKIKSQSSDFDQDFTKKRESQQLNTNYLASVDFIFDAAKKKRAFIENSKNDQ